MEKNTIGISVGMLLVGVFIGYVAFGDGLGSRAGGGHMMGNGAMMSQNVDQHFIVQMIPHHEGAIEMAHIALEHSKRPEIISLANGIIDAQTREIEDMTGWYEDWFGATPPSGGMGGMHMDGMSGDVQDLQAASEAEFDRLFINQMIPHHEMAIMMASMLAATTERDEMKQLADNITTSQAHEIDMMRSWRDAWY
jgi:uncharacterized protein (DUF305 family)